MKHKLVYIPVLLLAVAVCICAAGCTGTPGTVIEEPSTVTPIATGNATESVVDANNQFAFDLYSNLAQNQDGNLFFSPFSISSALAITYEGAKGETADQIESVFHFPADSEIRRTGFSGINDGINAGDPAYSLYVANALWAEKTYPFLPDFIGVASMYYSANTTNLDFINEPEESRIIINEWAEDKTMGKIRDLVPPGMIDSLTRLVITNAIYFKGEWVKQFDVNKTHEADFIVAPGKIVKVEMMERTDDDAVYRYTETDELQVLGMPYEHESGKELSMFVILPKGDDLSAVEKSLDAMKLTEIEKSMQSKQVKVFFPKFKMETEYYLSDVLKEMGMPVAFSGNADFSGMDGIGNLFISEVIHKAFVDVNEEGTEAAAATAVVMRLTAVMEEEPVPVFMANHPFVFLIQDDETGNILFMGRVADPSV